MKKFLLLSTMIAFSTALKSQIIVGQNYSETIVQSHYEMWHGLNSGFSDPLPTHIYYTGDSAYVSNIKKPTGMSIHFKIDSMHSDSVLVRTISGYSKIMRKGDSILADSTMYLWIPGDFDTIYSSLHFNGTPSVYGEVYDCSWSTDFKNYGCSWSMSSTLYFYTDQCHVSTKAGVPSIIVNSSVFPNPAKEKIYVDADNVTILNAIGVIVYNGPGKWIDLSILPEGVYYIPCVHQKLVHIF